MCPQFPGAPVAVHWSMADPAGAGGVEAFRAVADEIEERVALLLADLRIPDVPVPERTNHG